MILRCVRAQLLLLTANLAAAGCLVLLALEAGSAAPSLVALCARD